MTGASKRKGDRAELEIERIIASELGLLGIRRAFGAGRADDMGDITGVPNTVVQVANWSDALRAVRQKPLDAEHQRERADALFATAFVRLRGGVWRACLTPQQWATLWREAQPL